MPKKPKNDFCVIHKLDGSLTIPYEAPQLRFYLDSHYPVIGIRRPPMTTDTMADMRALTRILSEGRVTLIVARPNPDAFMSLVGVRGADVHAAFRKAMDLGADMPTKLNVTSHDCGQHTLGPDDVEALASGQGLPEGLYRGAAERNAAVNRMIEDLKAMPLSGHVRVFGPVASGVTVPDVLEVLIDLGEAKADEAGKQAARNFLHAMSNASNDRMTAYEVRDGKLLMAARSEGYWTGELKIQQKKMRDILKVAKKEAISLEKVTPLAETPEEIAEAFGFEASTSPKP